MRGTCLGSWLKTLFRALQGLGTRISVSNKIWARGSGPVAQSFGLRAKSRVAVFRVSGSDVCGFASWCLGT